MNKKIKDLVRIVVRILILAWATFVVFGFVAPTMISSSNNKEVIAGLFLVLTYIPIALALGFSIAQTIYNFGTNHE
jgi:hypothetical protein